MSDIIVMIFPVRKVWKFFREYFTAYHKLKDERKSNSLLRSENRFLEFNNAELEITNSDLSSENTYLKLQNKEIKGHLANTVRQRKVLQERLKRIEEYETLPLGLILNPEKRAKLEDEYRMLMSGEREKYMI